VATFWSAGWPVEAMEGLMDNKDGPNLDRGMDEIEASLNFLNREDLPTQTISLGDLFSKDITTSGSFDIRGGIWASTFGKVLQVLPIPVLLIDERRFIVVANQAWGKLNTGYERIQGTPFVNLFPAAASMKKAEVILERVFSTRMPQEMEALVGIDSNRIWGRITFRSIRIMADRFVLVLVENLTLEKKLLRLSRKYQEDLETRVEERTAELLEMNEKLSMEIAERQRLEVQVRQAIKMEAVGRLVGGVTHDFNNMLTVISGNVEVLLGRLTEDNLYRDRLCEISRAVRGAAALTRQLLAFSRHQKVDLGILDPNATICEFKSMLQRLIGQDIQVSMLLDQDIEKVRGDRSQIQQVIMNLAVNSRDAMPNGGNLRIETENVFLDDTDSRKHLEAAVGRYVMISVSDTGIGMRPEIQERIFDPFFSTKDQGSGTGLGLSTVYGIVNQHRGHIEVSSEPNQGTTFRVYLPAIEAEVR
jgi:signal transduction histidine kinase